MKHSGAYKQKFFITPEELEGVLKGFEQKQAKFHLTNSARTEHNLDEVCEAYRRFYQYFMVQNRNECLTCEVGWSTPERDALFCMIFRTRNGLFQTMTGTLYEMSYKFPLF
ncbi:hypothetical protein J4772_36030 [Cohnella sp. LGH]|uniref:hypothetical protein n=1 Tax=Cohnella sp. LGH TaxID=1619153 RepID=UPI001ADAB148|nr:hypothetical protein [Cohnella sp. LGH]QTH42792.1 hypothetical protein J4772_36030 [Cohnella sp. LGH]